MGTLYFGGNSLAEADTGTYNLAVPLGYRWILVYAFSSITSSATSGTRDINIFRKPGGNFSSSLFGNTFTILQNSFSTVSSANNVQLAPFSGTPSPTVQSYPDYEFTSGELINIDVTLLTGDTAKLLLVIKEVLDL